MPPNTALLTGPTGVGKTATVHALARQLGFKVLEVNASSLRGGRQVCTQEGHCHLKITTHERVRYLQL